MELFYANATQLAGFFLFLGTVIVALHGLERAVSRKLSRRFGWNSILLTGWLGVPLHELSHLAAAWLFGHRIVAFKLFDPDPVTGTLGYVRHAYRRRNLWQLGGSFMVGIAPLVSCAILLVGLLLWMVPIRALVDLVGFVGQTGSPLVDSIGLGGELVKAVWYHRSAWLPLQLYLAICIASHATPSPSDLKNGALGAVFASTLVLLAVAGVSARGTSVAPLSILVAPVTVLASAVAALQLAYLGVMLLIARIVTPRGSSIPGRRAKPSV